MSHISLDFETFFSTKLKLSLRAQIAEEYCRSPHFDCYLVSVYDGETAWAGHPKDFCWSALDGADIVSHNRYFDNTVWNELARRKLCPPPNFKSFHCTANLTAWLCNRRALKDAVLYLYGEQADKDYRTITEGKRWPDDFTLEEREIIIRGGKSDAILCWRLWENYGLSWPEMERRLSNQTIEQGMRGVQMDTKLLDRYIIETHDLLKRTEKLIPWVSEAEADEWEDFKTVPTSTKCIAEQCRRSGIPCPPVKADDAEGYEDWEALYLPRHPWIRCLTSWRSINKLYKTFTTAKGRLRSDGTMPFALKYFGAHTGRWSGDAKINFQNFRKVPLLVNEHGLLEQDISRIDDWTNEKPTPWCKSEIDFRRLIVPRPGYKMILCDLAAIEPRILAWLAGNTRLLDKMREGYGIYEAFARANMGYDGPKLAAADKKTLQYKMWKIQVLGLGYGAGWKKFITMCADGGVDITAKDPEKETYVNEIGETDTRDGFGAESRRVVADFRAKNKAVTDLWARLDLEFKSSLGGTFEMELPSGRKLKYENVRQSVRIVLDEKTKKPKKKWVFTANIGGRPIITYGGKLAENITQATAREVFGWHLLRLDDTPGVRVLFTSHDEAINEVKQGISAKDIEAVMSEAPPWLDGCPIAAEAKEVKHYEK